MSFCSMIYLQMYQCSMIFSSSLSLSMCLVQAVLSEMIKAIGGDVVVKLLISMQISPSALIFRLTCTISGIALPSSPSDNENDGLHAQLVAIIEDITSARDKMIPIRQLHAIQRQYPSTDIHQYLQKISAAFRRFVLDTLVKLDELDRAQEVFEGGGSTSVRASPYEGYRVGRVSPPAYASPINVRADRTALCVE
jgi:hypothetical protein